MAVLTQLFSPQRLGMTLTAVAMVAIAVGAWLWAQAPDYRVLYANVAERDGGAIITALQQMNVPYRVSAEGGTILVPAEQVPELRLKLASQGLPKGSLVGFELMENEKLGSSQFLEQVNYQRALEGELARSIQSLSEVQAARVHLALTKPSVFVREQQKPSASVLVNLYPGRTLQPSQVSAIMHLVAASVPDLPTQNVTVVDQNGNLLSADGQNPNGELDPNQLKYVAELENSYVKRIETILTPIVGAENLQAQVAADIDFSQTEHAEETYKPNQDQAQAAIRSQQTSESTSGADNIAGGVPGALSNQPPAPASAPIAAGPTPAGSTSKPGATGASPTPPSAPMNLRKEATTNYEVDRTIRHVRQLAGNLRRLSVAVVVNYRRETGADGKTTLKPLSQEEMTQITNLVKEATGFDSARGDTVSVANASFTTPEKETVAELPLWKQPETLDLAKEIGRYLLAAGVAFYLIFGVLKPMMRRLAAERASTASAPSHALPAVTAGADSYEQALDHTRQLAREEPRAVANVVKQWVGS
ncbi:MAG TPA: flagellar basal-body MS-ring/collar protein FliF [Burkholderiales bacterium]|nr:flagellar basal-body MS-ring/collar protein FliF [Burkholderiales bacterium]